MVCIVALAGLAIDVGNLEHVKAQMQAAADASATGGADALLEDAHPSITKASDTAAQYGMASGGRNPVAGVVQESVVQHIQVGCDQTYGPCSYPDEPNIVNVDDTADAPLFFLGIFGIDTAKVHVEAEACAPCSVEGNDIVLVLDHTGSMAALANATNWHTKIQNLKDGVLQGLLPSLNPDVDRVGLVFFPPVTAAHGVCNEVDNNQANSQALNPYLDPTRQFLVQPLTNGFLTSNGDLVPDSPVVTAVNCLVPGGHTDYADPLMIAEQELQSDSRPDVHKAIVLISDGAADYIQDPDCEAGIEGLPKCELPCEDGISAASSIKSSGIEIWAIALGAFGNDLQCKTSFNYVTSSQLEPTGMDGYHAMTQIASPNSYLGDPDPAQLAGILHTVAGSIGSPSGSRLVK